jgi:SRSO17 transposase
VAAELGDAGAVLIADETGFEKRQAFGRRAAAVHRHGWEDHELQIGVFLAYAVAANGTRVLIDRELYVPRAWTEDRDRCAAAGIGEEVAFATKSLQKSLPR